MLKPIKPGWQLSVLQAGFFGLAIVFALGTTLIVWRLSVWRLISPILGYVLAFATFVVLASIFYSIWVWLLVNRPETAESGHPRAQ